MSSTISTRRARRQHVRQQQHFHQQQQQQQQQTPSPSFLQDSSPKDAPLSNNNRLKISTKYSSTKDNNKQPILARCTRGSPGTLRRTHRGINHCGSFVWSLAVALILGSGILRRDACIANAATIFKPDSSRLHSVVSENMPQLNNSGEQEHLAAIIGGVNSIGGVIVATAAPHLPDTFGLSATAAGSSAEDNTINNTLQSYSIIDELAAAANAMGIESRELQSLLPLRNQPIFDFGMARNITGRTGQSEAIIKCRVDQLDDKSVSWIRKRDLHILSVGTATYTSDKRFEVTESKDAREWSLHVKNPQARDSGIYECQVNTEPKISMAFSLNILDIPSDARAIITGPPDLHFKTGSAIILNCNVEQPTLKDIGPIYWYRGNQLLTPVDDENEVDGYMAALTRNASEADFAARLSMQSDLGDTMKSRLRIANARTTDTGNYTCQPTTASGTSVMVHVLNDEKPAAMQKSSAPCLALPTNTFYMCVFAGLLLVLACGFPKLVLYRYVLGSLTLPTAFVLVALRVVLMVVCDEGLLIGMAYICWRLVTTIEPNFLQYPKG